MVGWKGGRKGVRLEGGEGKESRGREEGSTVPPLALKWHVKGLVDRGVGGRAEYLCGKCLGIGGGRG